MGCRGSFEVTAFEIRWPMIDDRARPAHFAGNPHHRLGIEAGAEDQDSWRRLDGNRDLGGFLAGDGERHLCGLIAP